MNVLPHPPRTTGPSFGKRPHIVVEEPPFKNRGVERIPSLRVGVPPEEESRMGNHSTLPHVSFLGMIQQALGSLF